MDGILTPIKICIMWVNAVLVVTCYVFVILSGFGYSGLFDNTFGNVTAKYSTAISIDFSKIGIWYFIFYLQCAFVVFSIVTIFVKENNERLCVDKHFTSIYLVGLYGLNLATHIAWLFSFDKSHINANPSLSITCFLTFVQGILLYGTLLVAYKDFTISHYRDGSCVRNKMLSSQIMYVHNGISAYAVIITFAQFTYLAASMHYVHNMDKLSSSMVGLSFIFVTILAYFLCELILLDRYTRYVLSPYIIFIWLFGGMLANKYDSNYPVTQYVFFLLALSIAMFLVKIAIIIYRSIKFPLFSIGNKVSNEKEFSET